MHLRHFPWIPDIPPPSELTTDFEELWWYGWEYNRSRVIKQDILEDSLIKRATDIDYFGLKARGDDLSYDHLRAATYYMAVMTAFSSESFARKREDWRNLWAKRSYWSTGQFVDPLGRAGKML